VVVDDTIVMVENVSRRLAALSGNAPAEARREAIIEACCQVRKPMLVGMMVIIAAYLPVLTLGGVEGRLFRPLAESVMLILGSSLLLTVTLVPALCRFGLGTGGVLREPKFMERWRAGYERLFTACHRRRRAVLGAALLIAAGAAFAVGHLGADFMPYLDEGWLVVEVQRDPHISLAQSIAMEQQTERAIRAEVPEVQNLFARIGMSAIATDPQGVNQNDIYLQLRPPGQWRELNGHRLAKAELGQLIARVIETAVPGQELQLNQPIGVRFDELLEGVRTDLALKLYGPDGEVLDRLAGQVADAVKRIPGAGEVVVDRPSRTSLLEFVPDPIPSVRFMIAGDVMNNAVAIGLGGREVGRIDEGDTFYPVVVRLAESARTNPATLAALPVRSADSSYVATLGQVGQWQSRGDAISGITREQASRREAVLVSVAGGDSVGFVARAREVLGQQITLPPGYRMEFAGAYRNWESGSQRLAGSGLAFILLALGLIYAALRNVRQTGLVACGLPFALAGGVYGLWLRGLPLTMPAAVGLVTLAGLSLLNGMVLVSCFNELCAAGLTPAAAALRSAQLRLRPVLMTALVAGLGFIPLALSTGQGAELQRPFATVVLFGIFTSTVLTLLTLPLWLSGAGTGPSRPRRQTS